MEVETSGSDESSLGSDLAALLGGSDCRIHLTYLGVGSGQDDKIDVLLISVGFHGDFHVFRCGNVLKSIGLPGKLVRKLRGPRRSSS